MFQLGQELINGFRLVKFLGRGHFGEVFGASAPGGGWAAIKIVRLFDKAGIKEYKALNRVRNIRHTHLIAITGAWLLNSRMEVLSEDAFVNFDPNAQLASETLREPNMGDRPEYLVIAMQPGVKNLYDLLQEYKKEKATGIPIHDLLRFMEGAAKAIDYLNTPQHDLGDGNGKVGLQHGDIKPANLILVGDEVAVCDFGLVHILSQVTVTASGMIGSPAYISPEAAKGKVAPNSDQFSLAIALVELRTGELPFDNLNPHAVTEAIRQNQFNFSRLTAAERGVIKRATSPEPGDRFRCCRDMVAAFKAAQATHTVRRNRFMQGLKWVKQRIYVDVEESNAVIELQQTEDLLNQSKQQLKADVARERDALRKDRKKLHEETEELKHQHEKLKQERELFGQDVVIKTAELEQRDRSLKEQEIGKQRELTDQENSLQLRQIGLDDMEQRTLCRLQQERENFEKQKQLLLEAETDFHRRQTQLERDHQELVSQQVLFDDKCQRKDDEYREQYDKLTELESLVVKQTSEANKKLTDLRELETQIEAASQNNAIERGELDLMGRELRQLRQSLEQMDERTQQERLAVDRSMQELYANQAKLEKQEQRLAETESALTVRLEEVQLLEAQIRESERPNVANIECANHFIPDNLSFQQLIVVLSTYCQLKEIISDARCRFDGLCGS